MMAEVHARSASILIVEDDQEQVRLYRKILRAHDLTSAASATEALGELERACPDLIILDHLLADGQSGLDLLPKLKERAAHVPVVVISGTLDSEGQLSALQGPLAAHYVIAKPVRKEQLLETIDAALRHCGFGETVEVLRSLEKIERIGTNQPERRFTSRLSRQHEILNRLRFGGSLTVAGLAREFHVDRKTIRRDLEDLQHRGQIHGHEISDS